ncbi:LPS export ABC transporter permease LptF [Coralloluteibacterium stylophorae]|uniref:Lipopolysaccharide export system permease protein LptF n=1 Tax=Coralloluteibacterium stylophorae TaxID=1776034 RepID=A0A8J8AY36_9GAMM|nr:LPS export ABC transporter permease LptF [Coralloluteibacterium stylophorae]MBS7457791.1 LPS export ABC transporter permease LptF [Coralloluteibacterium stylophorae]
MHRLERYLLREFAETAAATLVVLLLVSLSGVFADLVSEIARGKLPATLLLSQLGLRLVQYLPMVLPLALFLGLLMAIGRLYRDSEMAVMSSFGYGPQRLLRPLALFAVPVVLVVAALSLWGAPAAERAGQRMIDRANRSLLVAGLDSRRFVELPGGGVIYVDEMSAAGSRFQRLFMQTEDDEGRIDITTAQSGELFFDGSTERYLELRDGFRVEGPVDGADFRLMRFERNEAQLPDRAETIGDEDPLLLSTPALIERGDRPALAELHWRIGLPLLTMVLALAAIPLSRQQPRQPRYGALLLAFSGYLVYVFSLFIGRSWLGAGALPAWLGLWWLHLPMFAIALWLFARDGRMPRARRPA